MKAKQSLAFIILILFFGLSFNAYACLVPVNGLAEAAMGNGCSTPEEQPVYQVCDTFKTLSVQSVDKFDLAADCQALCPEDTASLALLVILLPHSNCLSDHPADRPPQDLLLKISVLRI